MSTDRSDMFSLLRLPLAQVPNQHTPLPASSMHPASPVQPGRSVSWHLVIGLTGMAIAAAGAALYALQQSEAGISGFGVGLIVMAIAMTKTTPAVVRPSLVRMEEDANHHSDWCYMHSGSPENYHPCFSDQLLQQLKQSQETIREKIASNKNGAGIHHLVLASDDRAFNLGGDLAKFAQLIRNGQRKQLLDYAKLCVEVAFNFSRLHEDRVHSIAVVQGDALGGGFEAALCCHTIIAEEGVGMGFPEVLFNLFPGMGAYTFLTRRVSPAVAERMMLNARIYTARELLEMGIVDYVVPAGEGLVAARDLIKRHQRIGNALRSMNTVRQACRPVRLAELLSVTSEWVDAAMRLDEPALRTMERLIRAQTRRAGIKHGLGARIGASPFHQENSRDK